jgi:aminoglycoside phosphotransferase (APT) family kinase protein
VENSNTNPWNEDLEELGAGNSHPWDADWEVSDELVQVLIYSQFSQLASMPIRRIGQGYDNMVYLVGETFVFRFPRRKIAIQLLRMEGKMLPKLEDFITVPYSKPLFYGVGNDDYPAPFLGYTYLSGSFPLGLTDYQRASSASTLAQFLVNLHTFPIKVALENNVLYDSRDILNITLRKEKMLRFMTVLTPHLQDEEIRKLFAYLHQLKTDNVKPRDVFLHGDLHFKNIIVNEASQVSGIIDWGDMNIGHPACDLSIGYSFLPSYVRQSFFEEYGEVDEETKNLARLIAIYIPMLLLMQAIDNKDDIIANEAKASIKRALTN